MKCVGEGHECDCEGEVQLRHTNTAYHYSEEDRKAGKPNPNYSMMCEAHQKLVCEHYQELWDYYYSTRF